MTPTRRVVRRKECNVITAEQFNAPGLEAIEPIGPDAPVRYTGAVFMLHDSTIAAGAGIGHHPHQGSERLFYLLSGGLHHDDALNRITADASAGDLAIFTEGRRGMIHAESNPTGEDARIWIIVAPTDPPPPTATVRVLDSRDAGSLDGGGVRGRELVGGTSAAEVHSDVRWLADLRIAPGATLTRPLAADEAVVVQPVAGRVRALGEHLDTDDLLALGPDDDARTLAVTAEGEPARVLVAVTGPGLGFSAG
ncbi:MAG TPA: pirin family protein [Euzebyales bacterium]|nr:pirin family protein [Euzebyales bacterium]